MTTYGINISHRSFLLSVGLSPCPHHQPIHPLHYPLTLHNYQFICNYSGPPFQTRDPCASLLLFTLPFPAFHRTYESTPQYANNSPHLYQYDYQNHRGASSPLDPGLGTPTRRDVAKRPAPAPPRGPVALYMSGVNRTPPSPPPGSTSFVGLGLSHSNSSDRSSPLDDSNHFGDGEI